MNRLACLRLTERCADILLSVREEIWEAGDEVGEELEKPIAVLVGYVKFLSHVNLLTDDHVSGLSHMSMIFSKN